MAFPWVLLLGFVAFALPAWSVVESERPVDDIGPDEVLPPRTSSPIGLTAHAWLT